MSVIGPRPLLIQYLPLYSDKQKHRHGLLLGLSQVIGQISIWPYLKKHVHFVKPKFYLMKRQMVSMAVLFIPQIAVSLYKLMDKIMIGEFCTKSQLGYYEYASRAIFYIRRRDRCPCICVQICESYGTQPSEI